jgi:hypothetical protein
MKKYVHFLTVGVSVSVVLGEVWQPKPRACKSKRKKGKEGEVPALSSPSYGTKVGLDPGLHNFFVAKNNTDVEDNKLLAKISPKEYYHETKLRIRESRRNVMQGIHGGKKRSMGALLWKHGRIPTRNTHNVMKNDRRGNDSQDPCTGRIKEICSLYIELHPCDSIV